VNIKSQKDFLSGLMFMGCGVAFAWSASGYAVGSGAHIGPGYFPLVLGVVLAVLGGLITYKALLVETVDGDRVGALAWRPLVCIVAANGVFGVMVGGVPSIHLPPLGLVAGVYASACISCLACGTFRLKEALLLATVLAAFSYLVFIMVFKMQIPVWPAPAAA